METAGTHYNEAIPALREVIPNVSNIDAQRKKVLEALTTDESKSWGDGILVWCNAVRTNPTVQLGINDRCLPFIVNKKKEDDFDSSIFSTSQHFTAKSSAGDEFSFDKTNCCVRCTSAVRYLLGVSKKEGDVYVHAVCEFMVENATTPALGGKKSVNDAFKNSRHSNGIDVSKYKYMFHKELDTKLMVEVIIGNKRKKR
jgi:hypothetical protein